MKKNLLKKTFVLLLSAVCLISCLVPVSATSDGMQFTATLDKTLLQSDETFTVTVSLMEDTTGLAVGSFYFQLSDAFEYVSSSIDGDEFSPVTSGKFAGCYVYTVLSVKNRSFKAGTFCTATFRLKENATGNGEITFFGYDLIDENFGVVSSNTVTVKLSAGENETDSERKDTPADPTPSDYDVTPGQTEDPTTPATAKDYIDVPSTHWAYGYIMTLTRVGIVNGSGNGTFSPDRAVTRAEFVKLIAGLVNGDVDGMTTEQYTDVKSDDWFAPYVAWATANNVTNGTSATEFSPNKPITREQAATVLMRAAKAFGLTLDTTVDAAAFADGNEISSYAKEAVTAMQKAGILSGVGGNRFNPKGTTTRAASAKMIAMLLPQ